LGKLLDIAEARLSARRFLCGDALTLADINLRIGFIATGLRD
jgi:glutathione S-transferase